MPVIRRGPTMRGMGTLARLTLLPGDLRSSHFKS
jgi:hypothetical protein